MRINATAYGRGKTSNLEVGVGNLTLKADCPAESKKLRAMYREIREGNLSFWTPLMWASQEKKITKKESVMLDKIIVRIEKSFLAHLD